MRNGFLSLFVCSLAWSTLVAQADDAATLLQQARLALMQGKAREAVALAGTAIAQEPGNPRAYLLRGIGQAALRQHEDAIRDFDKAISLRADLAEAYDQRGSVHFKEGRIKESLADFDKFLALKPEAKPGHWRRGIVLYYAGRFEDGRRQFEGYEQIDANDVENAAWHFLCTARQAGIEEARKSLLKVRFDRRVPLMEVYALFAGKAQPGDVLKAARAGQPSERQLKERLFYAYLYLGLYAEANGDAKTALAHMQRAAGEYAVDQYMGDVARVHRDLLLRSTRK